MVKRAAAAILALCLLFGSAGCTAAPGTQQPAIRELPVSGTVITNTDGLCLTRDDAGVYRLLDRSGAVVREANVWMEYDSDSDVILVMDDAYYRYPDGETAFTKAQMEENVKAFLQEHAPMGEITGVRTNIMSAFSEGYAANCFTAVFDDGTEETERDFYALVDGAGLVVFTTPLMAFTSGGGFPLVFTLDDCSDGLVRFTSEYADREGVWTWYERGYLDTAGNEVLVFSNDSNRDPDDASVTVVDGTPYSDTGRFYNGAASVTRPDGKETLCDRSGKLLLPFEYDSMDNDRGEYPAVYDKDKGWGYIDPDGQIVIPLEYDFACGCWGKYFVVEKDGLCGVVDENNNAVVPIEYEWMSKPEEGVVYAVKDAKAYAIILGE